MQIRLLHKGLSLVVGLFLASSLALTALQAAESKPALTVSTANPETVYKIAEKIATLTGTLDQFNDESGPFKELKGINPKNPIVLVFHSDGDEFKDPFLFLPITKFESVELPGFETLQMMAQEEGAGKYLINSPAGAFVLTQKRGYLVVSSESSEMPIPDDPTKFLKGLEEYTLGIRLDVENTSADAIQMLLAPIQIAAMMSGDPNVMQVFDQVNEAVETVCEEIRSATIGLTMDPKSGDVNVVVNSVPVPGSDSAKQIAQTKKAETVFGGFLGDKNAVAVISGTETILDSAKEAVENQLDLLISGLLEQVEENADDDDDIELAEAVAESVKKIILATLDSGKIDLGFSLGNDGTFAFGATLGEGKELENISAILFKRIEKMAPSEEEFQQFFGGKRLKINYTTVDGFKLSSYILPFDELDADYPPALADKTFYLYWGLKNDAFVLLGGFDPKSEDLLKKAVADMKKSIPNQGGYLKFSLMQLGNLLKSFQTGDEPEEFELAVKAFLAAGSDANVEIRQTVEQDSLTQTISISGKIWDALSKIVANERTSTSRRIRDF